MPETIYLDNHSTTRVDPRVLEAMWPWFAERVGNAASRSHVFGDAAAAAVEAARQQVAALIGASPPEIVFTSGATEANNLVLKGLLIQPPIGELVTSVAEHRAILDPARRLRRFDVNLTLLGVDSTARVSPQEVEDALTPATRLVSIMHANNEVGTLNPIREIGTICHDRGVLFHTDAAQSVGRVPVDVAVMRIDLMSFTAHKLYGPQGVGGLYVRKTDPPIPLTAQIDGGGHERRLRSGTLPVALIVGFGEACRIAMAEQEAEAKRIAGLRERLQRALVEQLHGTTVNGHAADRLPGNLNVSFENVDGDALLARLHQWVAVSSGSACTSADPEPSHVLRAMGISDTLARASLRFGIGRFNTEDQIDRAATIVIKAVRGLQSSR